MAEIDRDYLLIPTPEELILVADSMRGNIIRASRRGVVPKDFFGIRHDNANRILEANPHFAEHLERTSRSVLLVVQSEGLTPSDTFLAGAKDLLEILAITTTYTQLPDLET
jgi:hypothetical protein